MNRETALKTVQQTGFAMLELNLFLDTHPEDAAALAAFGTARNEYQKAVAAYESAYGPLTVCSGDKNTTWAWVETPWPWEGQEA